MRKKITVVGLGRVGLPLAIFLAEKGFEVIGVDIDEERIRVVSQGEMPFFERGAKALLKKNLKRKLRVTADLRKAISQCKTVILTLGTPVDEHLNPIFSQLENVYEEMNSLLTPGYLIILRSTVAPGTTEYLSRYLKSHTGFTVGKDIFLAFCPERIAEGYAIEELGEIPQIIGTLDSKSAKLAKELFKKITDRILLTDARSAELAKLYCNMYRYIDFAIGNEFMMIAEEHKRDIYEILQLVNKDYKRSGLKPPGLAAGPCLYKDGFFLISKVPYTELITTAWRINETTPAFLIDRIKKQKSISGTTVAILGLGFKRNIDDTRGSLSFKAKKLFWQEGANIILHDPLVEPHPLPEVLKKADIVMVAMNHDCYKNFGVRNFKKYLKKDALICDIWNILGQGKIIFKASEL